MLSYVVTRVVVCWVTFEGMLVTYAFSHVLVCLLRVLMCSCVSSWPYLPTVTRVVACGHACCCMFGHM